MSCALLIFDEFEMDKDIVRLLAVEKIGPSYGPISLIHSAHPFSMGKCREEAGYNLRIHFEECCGKIIIHLHQNSIESVVINYSAKGAAAYQSGSQTTLSLVSKWMRDCSSLSNAND